MIGTALAAPRQMQPPARKRLIQQLNVAGTGWLCQAIATENAGLESRGTSRGNMEAKPFVLKADYQPAGDQPQAIEKLVEGLKDGFRHQTLLGVTGSGKTYVASQVIAQVQRPTLVLAHNKTLAAQLYGEFKEFFPENSVEYFVSYYDYY